ncbi:MAG: DUF748 domain-containing protein [Burkholderiaceae bacterium]|nr:DUF748 domain-containing protein [Burkholderiaceae bacterium]
MGRTTVWMRRLLWFVVAVLLLWGVAWLGVPPLVRWQAQERLSELLARPVTIGKVEFSPWNLRLGLHDVAVAAAAGAPSQAPQMQIGALRADFDARSLLHLAPVLESLQIDAPRLRLTRTAAGHYDIDDLLARLAPRPDAPPGQPQRFAIYNLDIRDGEFVFDDRPADRVHKLGALNLTLPFVSNLPADLQVKVEPRLAFVLNGEAFDSGAQALPFTPERSGTLSLKVATLDLSPYLGYQPAALPVRVTRGKLHIDLGIDFAAPQNGQTRAAIHGTLGIEGLAVTASDGAALAELDKAALTLKDVRPLERKAMLGALEIEGLVAHVARDERGELSVARLLGPSSAAPPAAPASAASGAASAPAAPAAAPDAGWQIGLDKLGVSGSRVMWNDAAVRPHSAFVVSQVALEASRLQLPLQAPAPFTLQAVLRPQDKPDATLATVSIEGQASEAAAEANVVLESVSLAALAPYVSLAEEASISGTGAMRARLNWAAAAGDKPQQVVATIAELGLDKLKAGVARKSGNGGAEIVEIDRLKLAAATVDLGAARIAVDTIELERPDVKLGRDASGAWNVLALGGATPLAQDVRADVRAAASVAWQVALKDVRVADGRLALNDAAPAAGAAAAPVRLDVDRLQLGLKDIRLDGARLVSEPGVELSARVRAANDRDGGTLKWRGGFGLDPLRVRGTAQVQRFPLQAVQAYAPAVPGLRLERAAAGFTGSVALRQAAKGLDVDVDGDVKLSDLKLLSVPVSAAEKASEADRELASWQSFDLERVKLALRPDSKPKLAIGAATLSDFFARLILSEDGRLNLRDVTDRPIAAVPAATAASAPVAASAPGAQPRKLPIDLELGGLEFVNGRIDYSDHFIQPNYSAALTDLNGRLGAFDSSGGEPATLRLDGRVAGTGELVIDGKLRPGEVPRELDIKAKASNVELAPLSPYSSKYAGYPIERGKLTLDVHYRIAADGKLQADHQLTLNQLTFGEHVDSPDATKLPVLLAVSLLKDANGVIDIDLPVAGTLSDPKFSLGGIIWKIIVNLLTKAITAPFTLLAGSGGHDMSVIAFDPGTSVPTADGEQTLDKVAKALADRPALKVTITGEADPQAEHAALLRAMLDARLAQEQRRESKRATEQAPRTAALPAITGAERERLLEAVYKETDLPDKPRNLIGMQKDIPADQMEAMLLAHMSASPEAMRELAMQRGLVVRDALAAKGLAAERLFIGAPKMHAHAAPAGGAASGPGAGTGAQTAPAGESKDGAAWTPRAKLDLSTK